MAWYSWFIIYIEVTFYIELEVRYAYLMAYIVHAAQQIDRKMPRNENNSTAFGKSE
jgi:hypothetical protein